MKKSIFLMIALLFLVSTVQAEITLPVIISDGMVLQRNDTVCIWGGAGRQEKVKLTFQKKSYHTVADDEGNWSIRFFTQKSGGPYTMNINDITLNNVYVGDVWLTSGQSNMDLTISRVRDLYAAETDQYSNPAIHLIQVSTRSFLDHEADDLSDKDRWESCTPQSTGHWSALSCFFAKEMYEKSGVPQGIINSSQGGSIIEAWISRGTLQKEFPKYIDEIDYYLTDGYMQRCQDLNVAIGNKWNEELNNGDAGLKEGWGSPDYDDTAWEQVNMFDRQIGAIGGRPFIGTLWFRKEFDVPAHMAGKKGVLRLGCMIDADDSYLNGKKVGSTGYQYPPRIYPFDEGVLKAGRNLLTIRLMVNGSANKFVKDKPYKIVVGDSEISLEGDYKMRRGCLMPSRPSMPDFGNKPTGYYNAMIAPLRNYRIAGTVWYQGESNTDKVNEYQRMLELLAEDWRNHFGKMPLIIVQLANFMQRHTSPVESNWAALRNKQRLAAQTIPNAALATAVDLGEWNDIHPLRKKELAQRIALQAERICYGKEVVAEGPAIERCEPRGNELVLTFKQGTDKFAPCELLKGFTLAGSDKKYVNAHARFEKGQVIVWNEQVDKPCSVRYGWDDNPELSLYGANGLPAATFQCDAAE